MAFVPAICSQCGAKLKVDDSKEAGVCEYCGTPFVTEKAIKNYTTNITNNYNGANINMQAGNFDNYLELSAKAAEAGNGQEALDYAKRALEMQPESWKAWKCKMIGVGFFTAMNCQKAAESLSCGNNAIQYLQLDHKITDLEREKEMTDIYFSYLISAGSFFTMGTTLAMETENVFVKDYTTSKELDAPKRAAYLELANSAYNYCAAVPKEYIKTHENLQNALVLVLKAAVRFYKTDTDRLTIYGAKLSPDEVDTRKKLVNDLLVTLPYIKKREIDISAITAGRGRACYIATAVYGSYDCPQVWVLRRFRDGTLNQFWLGRLFIKVYYATSPTLVKTMGDKRIFKTACKTCLDRWVRSLRSRGYKDTPYRDK